MIASPDQLQKIADIVSRLDTNFLAGDGDNRRRLPRVSIRTEMTFLVLAGSAPAPVGVFSRNISPSGMGFVSRRMFRADERIAIPLRIPRVPPKLLLARVAFGRYVGGGLYEMGAEFLECVTDISGTGPVERFIPSRWYQLPLRGFSPAAPPPEPAAGPTPAAPPADSSPAAATVGPTPAETPAGPTPADPAK